MAVTTGQARTWMAQWDAAGEALAAQRRKELRELTPERALAASDALLSLADPAGLPDERRSSSGLVDQQAIFGASRR